MSVVYVIQKQQRFDHKRGELVPKFDLDTAREHGELFYLLSPSASPFKTDSVIDELHESLSEFQEGDHLLLVGNPVLIGLATAIAASLAPSLNFLQWSGTQQKYISIRAENLLG